VPLEYVCSILYFLLVCISDVSYWYLIFIIPLSLFNVIRYKKGDHKLYFITKGEYKQNFKRMEL